MNWLLIVILVVLIACIAHGYWQGFLRIAYSLVAWILIFAFVAWSKPYINDFLRAETSFYEKIETYCIETIRQTSEEQIQESTGTAVNGAVSGEIKNEDGTTTNLSELGMYVPEQVLDKIIDSTSQAAGEFLESSGIYDQIAKGMADFILDGVSFFIAFIVALLLSAIISQLLGIVSKIPVINGTNRFLGLGAGVIQGLLLVWIAFYIIALCSSGETGAALVTYIYESEFLTMLYENNLIVALIMKFF